MGPSISIVVPTFNRRSSIRRLLEALAKQTCPPLELEAVVVDDGSTDGTPGMLRDLDLPYALRVLEQAHQGPAEARNLGVFHARGPLIVFLDDDVVPLPDLLREHMAAHQAGPDLVAIGPMCPPRDWPRPIWVQWEEELLQVQYRELLEGKYACTPRQFYTANASLARSQFLEAGGFDPAFKRAEDVELAYRLREMGAQFVFTPRARVMHYASRSFASWCLTPYQYGRYDVAMHRDKGHEALPLATVEFHRRHPLNRLLARLCVGRQALVRGAVLSLGILARGAGCLGARRWATLALSGIFNLLYWQGVCDELGSPEPVWRSIAASARWAR